MNTDNTLPYLVADSVAVNKMIGLADAYIVRFSESRKYVDSALAQISSAEKMASILGLEDLRYRVLSEKARIFIKSADFASARPLFTVITAYHRRKGIAAEAASWQKIGDDFELEFKTGFPLRRSCYQRAYELYKLTGNRQNIADAMGKVADADLAAGEYAKAEQEQLWVIKEYQALKYVKIYYGYYMLSETYYRSRKEEKHLKALVNCVNTFEDDRGGNPADGLLYYFNLAVAYHKYRNFEFAITMYKKGMAASMEIKSYDRYNWGVLGSIGCYIKLGKYSTALKLMQEASKYPKTLKMECFLVSRELSLYVTMKRWSDARKIVPKFISLFDRFRVIAATNANAYATEEFILNYYPLPVYYIQTKQWAELRVAQQVMRSFPEKELDDNARIYIHNVNLKIDSVGGDYLSALKEHEIITMLRDSAMSIENRNRISELEAKYNSETKDKRIQLLNSAASVQKEKLEKVNLQARFIIVITIIAALFAAVLFFAYQGKRRSNLALKAKQQKINDQNNVLSELLIQKENLLSDKNDLVESLEGLLSEKEWLLKEVHHRVKNNLQIVMSLLYNQSSYLKSEDAKKALFDVQNRIQAIAIIHHKLYSKNSVASVALPGYISELTNYLSSIYVKDIRTIRFVLNIEDVSLNISQAVPIGLILNEAITNSIKYAFSKNGGVIEIFAKRCNAQQLELSIKDNGKGLPANFQYDDDVSLGIGMMKALTQQLKGAFSIISRDGVVIKIHFKLDE
ncbi:sensor histidine kinase [Mucilaginibacter conchicola]|nr:sensor histidine kinase [Mucilaginibacter conchicola]